MTSSWDDDRPPAEPAKISTGKLILFSCDAGHRRGRLRSIVSLQVELTGDSGRTGPTAGPR